MDNSERELGKSCQNHSQKQKSPIRSVLICFQGNIYPGYGSYLNMFRIGYIIVKITSGMLSYLI